jgi:hypothetical protein
LHIDHVISKTLTWTIQNFLPKSLDCGYAEIMSLDYVIFLGINDNVDVNIVIINVLTFRFINKEG